MRAAFLTAGAAGMFCGSCMHDNALARAMIDRGVDCLLQPIYTPIRTDEVSVASDKVFFGGIHIYMLQQLPWLRFVPGPVRRLLDWSPLLRYATQKTHSTSAAKLGQLATSMLRGTEGKQAGEARRLAAWLSKEIKPDAVVFSNLLIGGCLPEIRRGLPDTRIVVVLQGDDIFLDHLPAPYHEEAIESCRQLVAHVDRFVVHSQFYADKMARLLQIPADKIETTPLSIDTKPFMGVDRAEDRDESEFRVGYLARIAPEKGLHHLVDAFIDLGRMHEHQNLSLHVAGWLGETNRDYFEQQVNKIDQAKLNDRFEHHGSPDMEEKIEFLRNLDLLCVPTDYEDPKGLFVLEALAAGVPVIQPDHGAFGELIAATGGGLVVPPADLGDLGAAISQLKSDDRAREEYARVGRANVHANHSIEQAAAEFEQILFE